MAAKHRQPSIVLDTESTRRSQSRRTVFRALTRGRGVRVVQYWKRLKVMGVRKRSPRIWQSHPIRTQIPISCILLLLCLSYCIYSMTFVFGLRFRDGVSKDYDVRRDE